MVEYCHVGAKRVTCKGPHKGVISLSLSLPWQIQDTCNRSRRSRPRRRSRRSPRSPGAAAGTRPLLFSLWLLVRGERRTEPRRSGGRCWAGAGPVDRAEARGWCPARPAGRPGARGMPDAGEARWGLRPARFPQGTAGVVLPVLTGAGRRPGGGAPGPPAAGAARPPPPGGPAARSPPPRGRGGKG